MREILIHLLSIGNLFFLPIFVFLDIFLMESARNRPSTIDKKYISLITKYVVKRGEKGRDGVFMGFEFRMVTLQKFFKSDVIGPC